MVDRGKLQKSMVRGHTSSILRMVVNFNFNNGMSSYNQKGRDSVIVGWDREIRFMMACDTNCIYEAGCFKESCQHFENVSFLRSMLGTLNLTLKMPDSNS